MKLKLAAFILGVALLNLFAIVTPAPAAPLATLEGRAVLPADTFAPGPPSGKQIDPTQNTNGRKVPFASQPVQGFSALLDAGNGTYWAMADNGYGAKANSGDFLLRVYRITPTFKTARGGDGSVKVGEFIQLRDPDKRVPFKLVNDATPDRLLTGADFDIESLRIDPRGDLWFGDEFGPFLIHADATGKLLEAPIPLPGVKSPDNPTLAAGAKANLASSRGFEGMAISTDGATLYPMLEGALTDDADPQRRYIYAFDVAGRRYTGVRYAYRCEDAAYSIGDFTQLDANRFIVIERDAGQGTASKLKKLYLVDFRRVGADGYLQKRELVDLLNIADPNRLSLPARDGDIGLGETFSFPFTTIEDVLPLGDGRLLVANDNNYPFSAGRNPKLPDDNELIIIRVPELAEMPGLPNTGRGGGGTPRESLALLAAFALLAAAIVVSGLARRAPR